MTESSKADHRPSLSSKQRLALSIIVRFIEDNDFAPTYSEIADSLGARSVSSAVKLVRILERKGYLERTPGTARSLRLPEEDEDQPGPDRVVELPVVDPNADHSEGGSSLWLDRSLVGAAAQPARCRAVRIGDGGMQPVGIRIGDVAVVEPVDENTLLNGDMIACIIDRVPVIRRIHQQDTGIRLTSAEPSYTTVVIREFGAAVRLLGRPILMLRRM